MIKFKSPTNNNKYTPYKTPARFGYTEEASFKEQIRNLLGDTLERRGVDNVKKIINARFGNTPEGQKKYTDNQKKWFLEIMQETISHSYANTTKRGHLEELQQLCITDGNSSDKENEPPVIGDSHSSDNVTF